MWGCGGGELRPACTGSGGGEGGRCAHEGSWANDRHLSLREETQEEEEELGKETVNSELGGRGRPGISTGTRQWKFLGVCSSLHLGFRKRCR